ncbi:hypothetical protein [Clostridium sp. YIM B02555]|uniref:hypothetical protein n=1 Tax=Clostridium sp. YIM B02555 TaxID=2911968 RepID=UPI001EED89CA|nr:hypothetical protein [Clostridium sp. YIM B02555]
MQNKVDYMQELGRTFNNKVSKHIVTSMFGTGVALGTKTLSGVLVDGQTNEYIGEDCLILDQLLLESSYTTSTNNEHSHTIQTPDNFKINTGDRVLVALLGTACVIIGRVTSNG